MNYYLKVLKNYATFTGRARRKELWMYFLFFTDSVLLFFKKNRIIPNMYVNDMDNERNIHKGYFV